MKMKAFSKKVKTKNHLRGGYPNVDNSAQGGDLIEQAFPSLSING